MSVMAGHLQKKNVRRLSKAHFVMQKERDRYELRRQSNETDIPSSSVHRILKHIGKRPYKLQLLHDLQPADYEQRVEFGQWFLRNQEILPNIFWSDESYFHLDGAISRYHCRIWNEEKPMVFLTKPLHPKKLCVWVGFNASFIIEPYFFDPTVNSRNYLEMLQNHVLSLIHI